MRSKIIILQLALSISFFPGCNNGNDRYDATGTFEAEEIIVSAEATGKILAYSVTEGARLDSNQVVGRIDPTAIELQKEQASSTVKALEEKTNSAAPQIDILQAQLQLQRKNISVNEEQLKALLVEQQRFQKLVAADAVPSRQLDDINGQVDVGKERVAAAKSQLQVLQSQITAQRQSVAIQNRGILSEKAPMEKKVAQIQDQLDRTIIRNPAAGTVLTKYASENEFASIGKPLYRLADLETMKLRAYITGNQLAKLRLNQVVKVLVDDGNGKYKNYSGTVSWISDKAEFTPKTIQTKDERANQVYAIKVNVANDGYLKIGMYGEVKF